MNNELLNTQTVQRPTDTLGTSVFGKGAGLFGIGSFFRLLGFI